MGNLGTETAMLNNLSRNRVASVVVPPQLAATLNRRVCHLKHPIHVLPLLQLTHSLRPNFSELDQFVLTFKAENLQSNLTHRFNTSNDPLSNNVILQQSEKSSQQIT